MTVRVPFAALTLALCLATHVAADDKKNETDLKSMVGNWTVEKAELGGKDSTVVFKTLKFEIREGGKYTVELGEKDEGAFTVNASKSPKEMDIMSDQGPNKGKTIKAIYKLDGDALTVCYNLDPNKPARPEKFESPASSKTFLVTYKRAKK
ncbi:hypothetical protein GobsT_00340 [Gemmata obscuriglobus]|uniref:TIGR03067 domain-containing protein n=1 Tax=Gemmata obscuriglobus TaxID=114 RepID=A0A2Z3HCP4_9BACT|nr:TIGR03067 domain-containing protein [Gemmata obscuriglobus]AWM41337.1 TIGR03067 domain-containing protein [Gemmata obscuriglobus]QEG25310.1 hypothetical protein GobsT_00340 [Gemmata obscuriglobus]VTR98192.1 Uncharacterized protein OS=Pedosphaera parvula (strain Ellin514) GN=Cflav_PD2062 PE=4 SV=1 [Gemmata obscuriglobus UQM 2246]